MKFRDIRSYSYCCNLSHMHHNNVLGIPNYNLKNKSQNSLNYSHSYMQPNSHFHYIEWARNHQSHHCLSSPHAARYLYSHFGKTICSPNSIVLYNSSDKCHYRCFYNHQYKKFCNLHYMKMNTNLRNSLHKFLHKYNYKCLHMTYYKTLDMSHHIQKHMNSHMLMASCEHLPLYRQTGGGRALHQELATRPLPSF